MKKTAGSRSATLQILNKELQVGTPAPETPPRWLKLSDLHLEPLVFQVRVDGLDIDRAKKIKRGLMNSDPRTHDPLTVWWTGTRWVVLDGHHRLEAYKQYEQETGEPQMVPVNPMAGLTLEAALGLAATLNCREKATITREEKSNTAWAVVCYGHGSIKEQATWTGVSTAQINNMRKARAKLKARRISDDRLIDQGWDWCRCKAKKQDEPELPWDEQRIHAMAKKIAPEMARVGGGALVKNPDVFARALAIVSEAAPERLIETDAFLDALVGPGRRLLEELEDEEEMQEAMKIPVDF